MYNDCEQDLKIANDRTIILCYNYYSSLGGLTIENFKT